MDLVADQARHINACSTRLVPVNKLCAYWLVLNYILKLTEVVDHSSSTTCQVLGTQVLKYLKYQTLPRYLSTDSCEEQGRSTEYGVLRLAIQACV